MSTESTRKAEIFEDTDTDIDTDKDSTTGRDTDMDMGMCTGMGTDRHGHCIWTWSSDLTPKGGMSGMKP
jgi:hypothetical protein